MREQQFRAWLKQTGAERTTQVSDAKHLECDFGNLDERFEDDRCNSILNELSYSKEDAERHAPNPSKMNFKIRVERDTDEWFIRLRKNLDNYRHVTKLYVRFRDEININPPPLPAEQADLEVVSPDDRDGRERILQAIAVRRGQQKFRDKLRRAYEDRCALSGCNVVHVLEAAHIIAYLGSHTNQVSNGILLRADIHTLFDSGLIGVNGNTLTIVVHSTIQKSEYGALHGQRMRLPRAPKDHPDKSRLAKHLESVFLQSDGRI